MQFLTNTQSTSWSTARGFALDSSSRPVHQPYTIHASFSKISWTRLTWLSRFIATSLEPYEECLLWVTTWGVWGSSENLHMFYKLRESYGERRLLNDVPGHLFLGYEAADLATYIQLAIIFGWDFHLLHAPGYANKPTGFVSHDEFMEFYFEDEKAADEMKKSLHDAEIEFS